MAGLEAPYVQLAALCERVIEDKEGVLSLIRVIDRIIVQAAQLGGQPGTGPPAVMPAVPIQMWLVVAFKSGPARGTRRVGIALRSPAGMKIGNDISAPIFLEGDDRGHNLALQVNFTAPEEGLYWFDVAVDDRLVTRVPLRVVYQPMSVTQPPQL